MCFALCFCYGKLFFTLAPLFDLFPIGLGSLFCFVRAIFVIGRTDQSVRQILLGNPVIFKLMRIKVVLALVFRVRAVVVLVLQLARRRAEAALFHVCHRGVDGVVAGIALWRGRPSPR